ncbi:MAG: DUF4199 domain-containing protein [Odoribacteraceae bacterium]|jgi:hypothetical protein|nr:DUF4199 domain-containing protein [Odoribacteraceae bacterium]
MTPIKQRPIGPVMAFGLLAGASLVITSLLFLATGREVVMNPRLNNLLYCLLIIACFFGVKKLRDDLAGGLITYGRAFASGFKIVLVAAILHALGIFFLYASRPDLSEKYKTVMLDMFKEVHGDSIFYAMAAETFDKVHMPAFIALEELLGKVLTGTFICLIIAAILRRAARPNA